MKIKTILMLFALLAIGAVAYSAEPVSLAGFPNSRYTISQSTMAVSSTTVQSIVNVSTYRKILIQNLDAATTVYYRIDGSTAHITTVGWPIYPRGIETIETDAIVSMQIVPSATIGTVDIKKKIIQK